MMPEKFKANPSMISCILTGVTIFVIVVTYFYYFYPSELGLFFLIFVPIIFFVATIPLLSKDHRERTKIKKHMLELFKPPMGYQLKYDDLSSNILHQERDNWYHMNMRLKSNEGPWDDSKGVDFYFNIETERTK